MPTQRTCFVGTGAAYEQMWAKWANDDDSVDWETVVSEVIRCLKRYIARRVWRLLEHGPPLERTT